MQSTRSVRHAARRAETTRRFFLSHISQNVLAVGPNTERPPWTATGAGGVQCSTDKWRMRRGPLRLSSAQATAGPLSKAKRGCWGRTKPTGDVTIPQGASPTGELPPTHKHVLSLPSPLPAPVMMGSSLAGSSRHRCDAAVPGPARRQMHPARRGGRPAEPHSGGVLLQGPPGSCPHQIFCPLPPW